MIQIIKSSDISFDKKITKLWKHFRQQSQQLHLLGLEEDWHIYSEATSPKNKKQLWLRSMQAKGEILTVLDVLQKSQYVLEIGAGWGATHFLLKSVSQNVISIDKKFHLLAALSLSLRRLQKLKGSYFILGESSDAKTFEQVQRILGDHKLDALYVDGDHSYQASMTDYKAYLPLVKEDGVIFFHDYFHEKGINQAVNQIAQKYPINVVVDESHPIGTAWHYKDGHSETKYALRNLEEQDCRLYMPRPRWKVLLDLIIKHKLKSGVTLGIGKPYFFLLENVHDLALTGISETHPNQTLKYGSRASIINTNLVDAANNVSDASMDFVFIDDFKDSTSIKQAIQHWWPKVKKKGFLLGYSFKHPSVKQLVKESFKDVLVDRYVWIARKK
ncbi:hypothetical protein LCGC14_1983220 [marine sediment metagenome]|uniref:Methyltransferase domain-containing protein n=1 Tax=marine sediment metagenome TaxID=412755 RepID=A0A0F9I5C3_9ZZZZ